MYCIKLELKFPHQQFQKNKEYLYTTTQVTNFMTTSVLPMLLGETGNVYVDIGM